MSWMATTWDSFLPTHKMAAMLAAPIVQAR